MSDNNEYRDLAEKAEARIVALEAQRDSLKRQLEIVTEAHDEQQAQVVELAGALAHCLEFLRGVEWDDRAALRAEDLSEEADAALTHDVAALVKQAKRREGALALIGLVYDRCDKSAIGASTQTVLIQANEIEQMREALRDAAASDKAGEC